MYLKSLELHGFKSFPEKTVLNFDSGATVIVGPNGSGKSNITDAMRWVLGELSSRSIRGTKMEDVIFIGADGRKPMSFAEVSVTFDNTGEQRVNSPYDEITVTRRYYRAGESEYFINKKPCRLRDIYELFLNTGIGREGYSIIGQGRIAEIISKKSEDRRGIFEETAGISRFRYQKEEAEKRLRATDENVSRVMDIYTELENRLPGLEKDSQKARKYLEIYGEKKELDVSLWLYDIERITSDKTKTEADFRLSQHELEMISDTEAGVEAQSQRLYEASLENKAESQSLYEEIKALREEQKESEGSRRVQETNLKHLREQRNESESKRDGRQSQLTALEEDSRQLFADRKRAYELLNDAAEAVEEIQKEKNGLVDMRTDKEQLIAELVKKQQQREAEQTERQIRLNVLRNTISDQTSREGSIGSEIEEYARESVSLEEEMNSARDAIDSYADAVKNLARDAETDEGTLTDNAAAIQTEQRTVAGLQGEIAALDGRVTALQRMQEHFDGFASSVKYVMEEAKAGRLKGIRGPVSTLISVPEKYTVAIETALGSALQNIVVDHEDDAKRAIASLKRAGAGRATFYPISSVKGQNRSRELEFAVSADGFEGYANEVVRTDEAYSEILRSLLGRIAIFSDLDKAAAYARSQLWRVRCVTLDGQQINAGGSFTGGSAKRDSGILTRNAQIDQLIRERDERNARLEAARGRISALEKTIEETERHLAALADRRKVIEALLQAEQTHFDGLEAKKDVADKRLEQLRSESESLSGEHSRDEADVRKLEELLLQDEEAIRSLSEKREAQEKARNGIDRQIEAVNTSLTEAQVKLAESRKDCETADASVGTYNAERERIRQRLLDEETEMKRLDGEIESTSRSLEEMQKASEEAERLLDRKEDDRKKKEEEGLEFERRLNELRVKQREVSNRKNLIFQAHTKNENRLEQLTQEIDKMTERLWDEYELTRTSAAELRYPPVTYGERVRVAQRLTELRNQLRGLGNVNVASIDEYREVKERYDAMKLQLDDLQAARKDVEDLILGIETEMKSMFISAFEQINRNFGEVFAELFGGGHAHLTLSDPSDVLNCGIEINVAPPGKMIKNLSLLSGGEQAFVAIALLFALIKVNPSPFCIFDEIEAALDEVNVTRVAKYIKRYSETMQIIMITHRRGTMEIADTLYGVTMPRHGISKVFTLNVNDISAEEAEKLTTDRPER